MRTKLGKKHFSVLFCIAALILLCIFALTACKQKKLTGFFELVEFSKEEVTAICVEYDGVQATLTNINKERILESLEKATPIRVLETEVFREEPYVMYFETADGDITMPFCWFDGKGIVNDEYGYHVEYLDRRFDVQVDGTWYEYEQSDEQYWNGEKTVKAFNQAASMAGKKARKQYEIDGYDSEMQRKVFDAYFQPGTIGPYDSTAEELMDESEIVVLAELSSYEERIRGHVERGREVVPVVTVKEVLKGDNVPETLPIICEESIAPRVYIMEDESGVEKRVALYVGREQPPLQEGELYLLCLQKPGEGPYNNEYYEGCYQVVGDICGTAKVIDGVTYPRYNTEYHPFYQRKVEELAQYEKAEN